MSARPSRFLGLLFSLAAVVALVLYFRDANPTGPSGAGVPRQRGGELVATIPADPRTFNPLAATDAVSRTIGLLTQGVLVRVNRATFENEAWLAERWDSSADGLTHTFYLRPGLVWSDGTPLTAADVLFSLDAAYDGALREARGGELLVEGEPVRATAPDARTVVVTFPRPSGRGAGLLDALPILPRHKLESARSAGTFPSAWGPAASPAEVVGAGPFILREHLPGQRVVLERNPRYWRTAHDGQALPYLDRLILEVVPDHDAAVQRLTAGSADLTHDALGPADYVTARRAEEEGRLRLMEAGVATDADALWFCLDPQRKRGDPRWAFVQRREFRQAISHAIDREEFAHRVYAGQAVPIWGPVTPGNRQWFTPNVPRYAHDVARVRELLRSLDLEDRNGNGVLEDARGTEARFTVLTPAGDAEYERAGAVLSDYAAMAGIALEITPIDPATLTERLSSCDYDAMYARPAAAHVDPAGNLDFWLSSGVAHVWHPAQKGPATEWERRIDELMIEYVRTADRDRRRDVFVEVQRVFAEQLPALYFAAPRLFYAHSPRVTGVMPSVLPPPVLWSADTLAVEPPR